MSASAEKFRKSFQIAREKVNWFPGHMNASFRHMQGIMRKIDCVVEVHDARIPISGRNPKFLWSLIGPKPHILVFNKKDLISKSSYSVIKEKCLEENCENVLFTNCLDQDCQGLHKIIPLALDLIHGKELVPKLNSYSKMMVVGVPNVGKSSLINALRNISLGKGKATAVGAMPGVTRAVQNEIKVYSDPPMYLIDTPGILAPNISDTESGMKLALCACLNENIVGVETTADFLLYWMNRVRNFIYVNYFGLKEPTDKIFPLLLKIACDNNFMRRMKNLERNTVETVPDIYRAANLMVKLYQRGKFGDLNLDQNHLDNSYR